MYMSGWLWRRSGSWFNIKISSYQYRESHYGDKTVIRLSYLHNGISYAGEMTSLYWIRALKITWFMRMNYFYTDMYYNFTVAFLHYIRSLFLKAWPIWYNQPSHRWIGIISGKVGRFNGSLRRQVMQIHNNVMMTSSNGNIFRVTGHLCGKFTGPRWISHTKASDAELWCLLWSAPE